jgi:thiol:disulfide interchange protein DsbC
MIRRIIHVVIGWNEKGVHVRTIGAALAVLVVLLLSGVPCYAFKEGSQNCTKCHSMTEKDLAPILEKANLAGAKVLSIRMSPIKGLWEAGLENKGQRFVVYVDFSRKYISPGPIIEANTRRNLTRERGDELNKDKKVDLSKLSFQGALVMGKADAPIKVAVFTDPG